MRTRDLLRLSAITVFAVTIVSFGSVPVARGESIPEGAASAPGEFLMKLRSDAIQRNEQSANPGSQGRTGLTAVDAELDRLEAVEVRRLFSLETNADRKRAMGLDRIFVVRYLGSATPEEAVARVAGLPEIEWAEPNRVVRGTLTPNDTYYEEQWGLHNRGQARKADGDSVGTSDGDLDANQAWDVTTGSFAVIVAVLDTGLDAGHPEFANRAMSGWDFVNEDSSPLDDHGHGTSCAGVAAAAGNNGQGVAGIAWGVRVLPVKVLDSMNNGTTTDLVQGIAYATDQGADVLSMSLGSANFSQAEKDAVDYAYSFGCTMFAASGNDNTGSIDYPAALDHVISVGALSPCNERKSPSSCDGETTWGSNWGIGLDVLAPGVLVHTTDIRGAGGFVSGDYLANFRGTSAATPFAAGVAALILSQVFLTPDQIATVFYESCDDIGAPGYDTITGWGRLNAYAAVRRAKGGVFVGPNAGFVNGSYYFPYRTVRDAVNAVPTDNYVIVRPGNYDEVTPWTNISKVLHMDAIDGGVTIR
jgi:subtilisin family serine protease